MADAFDTSDAIPEQFDTSDAVPEPVSGNANAGQTPQAVAHGGVSLDPSMVAAQQAAYNGPKHPDLDAAVQTAHDFAGELGRSVVGQTAGALSQVWNSVGAPVVGAAGGDLAALRERSPEAADAARAAWTDKASWHPSSVYAPEGANLVKTPYDILNTAMKSVTTPEGFRALDGWARTNWGDHYVDQVENELRALHPNLTSYVNLLQQTPRAKAVAAAALKQVSPTAAAWAPTVGANLQAAATLTGAYGALRGGAGRLFATEGEPTGIPEPAEPLPAAAGPQGPAFEDQPASQPLDLSGAQEKPATPPAAAPAPTPTPAAPAPTPAGPGASLAGAPRSQFPSPAEDGAREGKAPATPQEVDARAATLQRALGAALPEVHTSVLEGNYQETGNDVATAKASNVPELRERSQDLVAQASGAMDDAVKDMAGGADASPQATDARSQDVADAMTALGGHLDRHIQMIYDRARQVGGNVDVSPVVQWLEDNKSRFQYSDAGKTLWSGTSAKMKAMAEEGGATPQQLEQVRQDLIRSYKPETGHFIRGANGEEGIIPQIDGAVAKSLGEDVYAGARAVRTAKGALIDNNKVVARFAPGVGDTPKLQETNREVPSAKVLPTLLSRNTSTPQFQAYFDTLKNGRDFLAQQGDTEGAADMTARIARAADATREELSAQAHKAGSSDKGWQQNKFSMYLQSVEPKLGIVDPKRMDRWRDLNAAGNILKYDKQYHGAVAQGVKAAAGAGGALTSAAGHAIDVYTHGASALAGGGQSLAGKALGHLPGIDSPAKAMARYNAQRVTNLQTYTKRAP